MTALSLAYGFWLRAHEVFSPRVLDIASDRQLIQVELSKGRRNGYAILSLDLRELLRA